MLNTTLSSKSANVVLMMAFNEDKPKGFKVASANYTSLPIVKVIWISWQK